MVSLFDQGSIGNLSLKNRMIRSATWEGMCDPDGRPTDKLIDYYRSLAKGGIGLIISGYTYIRPEGKQLPGKMGLYNDTFARDFKKMTRAVHKEGCKIAIQLVHAGGQASVKEGYRQPVAPSAIKIGAYPQTPIELSILETESISDAFAQAAERAREWGFDAVQIHGAHGYLVNQFLSPVSNRRTDAYGGDLKNRSRFLFDVYDKIRAHVGKEFPVFIKFNGADNVENGFTKGDALIVAKNLSDAGIDAIEISSGTADSGEMGPARKKINTPEKEAYNLELARAIKMQVQCPVICVGGFRTLTIAKKTIADNGMDFIALSRPLIRQPDLPNRWAADKNEICECISCNKCFMPGISKGGIYCVPKKTQEKKT
ncbi:MAG: NADH:flavin oxidoreductase [Desulfobacula sp.]|nr:NADH:flavin oxidoreductase [Desulfobacula sp.]